MECGFLNLSTSFSPSLLSSWSHHSFLIHDPPLLTLSFGKVLFLTSLGTSCVCLKNTFFRFYLSQYEISFTREDEYGALSLHLSKRLVLSLIDHVTSVLSFSMKFPLPQWEDVTPFVTSVWDWFSSWFDCFYATNYLLTKKKNYLLFFFLVKQTFITLEEFIPQLGVWLQPKRKLILPLHQPLHYLLLCLVFAIDFDVTSLDFFFCWRFERLPLATSKTCLLCHILHFSVNVITSLSWWLLVVVPMSFHLGFIIPKIYVKGLHESSFEKSNTRVFKKLNWIY